MQVIELSNLGLATEAPPLVGDLVARYAIQPGQRRAGGRGELPPGHNERCCDHFIV